MNLLSRDHITPIKRLQDSYKSPINSYKSLIKRLQQNKQNARIFKFLPPMCHIRINFLSVHLN